MDSELESRINNIMENERLDHERAMKDAEREILEVNKTLATVHASSERQQKDMIALRQEYNAMSKQVATLFDEKAALALEMQEKVERERQQSDVAYRQQTSQMQDMIEKVRNLEFSLESSRIRA